MSSQAEVHSIEALREFRAALAVYGDDVLAALGAADAEIRRTIQWLQQDRPFYWQEQIKRRRERVATAKADLFRLKLQKTPEHHPSLAEPKERLRVAEAALQDAEKRLILTRKWQPALQQAVLEYQAGIQRLRDLASSDVPRSMALLAHVVEALESYLSVQPPSTSPAPPASSEQAVARATPELESIARDVLDREAPAAEPPDAGPPREEGT